MSRPEQQRGPALQHLFNSSGDWIAFRRGDYVFNTSGNWIGWLPWADDEVVDVTGEYLGTITGNRLFRFANRTYRGYPGYPGYPGHAGYPGYPGHAGYYPRPPLADDVDEDRLEAG